MSVEPVMSNTCTGAATTVNCDPTTEAVRPMNSSRNCRDSRRGVVSVRRRTPRR